MTSLQTRIIKQLISIPGLISCSFIGLGWHTFLHQTHGQITQGKSYNYIFGIKWWEEREKESERKRKREREMERERKRGRGKRENSLRENSNIWFHKYPKMALLHYLNLFFFFCQLISLLHRSSWVLFKRINWKKEKQNVLRRKDKNVRCLKPLFHLLVYLLSFQKILAEYVNDQEGGGEVRGHFTVLPRVLFPQLSCTERWSPQGTSPAIISGFIAFFLQSQLCFQKGLPLFVLSIFSSAAVFATLVASQRGYLIHLTVQL